MFCPSSSSPGIEPPRCLARLTLHCYNWRELQEMRATTMWGYGLAFWQAALFWSIWITAFAGAIGVGAGLFSAIVGSKLSDVMQADADRRIEEVRTQGDQARAEAARANAEAEKARLEQERIKAQLAWRRLSFEQLHAVAAGWRAVNLSEMSTRIRLVVVASDPEAMMFATDMRAALAAAGVKKPINTVLLAGAAPVVGIIIYGSK